MNLFPAIKCNELYAEEIKSNNFYAVEFSDDAWLCPNVREIQIYNNPFLFDYGSNLVATINDCTVATDFEEKKGIASYSDATCKTFDEA